LCRGTEWKFTRQLGRIELLATIQIGILSASKLAKTREGIVRRNYLILGMATLAAAGAVLAQDTAAPPAKTGSKKAASHGLAVKGKEVFEKKCAICHYADKDSKKIGPGLKGMYKRGTFTVNGNKITDESLKTWIENGDSLMPPMKETLEADQIKDVIAYVKTL
jgi:cytochrome c